MTSQAFQLAAQLAAMGNAPKDYADQAAESGRVVKQLVSMDIPSATGTSDIPNDDTPPTVTEGTQVGSQTITLSDAASKVVIQSGFLLASLGANRVVATLFRGSTLLASTLVRPGNDGASAVNFNVEDVPGSVGPHTYSVRVGRGTAGGTWFVGQDNEGAKYNGSLANGKVTIMEVAA